MAKAPRTNRTIGAEPARALKAKDQGEDVFWLQNKLKEMGYYKGTVTGTYLDGTRDAVKAFQKANSLSANGNADKKTLQALYDLVRASASPTPPLLPTDPPPHQVAEQPASATPPPATATPAP